LVAKGAKVDARDERMCTPLHYAAGDSHLDVVKWLVKHKADINAKDKEGNNVFYYAIVNKNSSNPVAEYLTKKGAKYEDK
jgi:ankyrin repeat protein